MSEILVFVEFTENNITDLSLQALRKGAELAQRSGLKLSCVAAGSEIQACAKELFSYGAQSVHMADDPKLKTFLPTSYRKAASGFLKQMPFALMLLPATTRGNNLAPLLAHDLGAACALDCHLADFENGAFVAKRSEFDGKAFARYSAAGRQGLIVTVKDGIADAAVKDPSKSGDVRTAPVAISDADLVSKVLKREVVKSTVDLKRAKVIVTAGAGIGTKDNFKLVEDLAAALGGEVGATRPVVDAGWTTADRQIGQTGVTVKPDLYIACGVSGAVQHRVGMMNARKIVAINTDAAAPIFKFAHYRVTGDLVDVIPKLIKVLK